MFLNDIVNPLTIEEAKATSQRLDPNCWTGKHKEGTKVKNGVRVNNCVPNESLEESEGAWPFQPVNEIFGFQEPPKPKKPATTLAQMRQEFSKEKPIPQGKVVYNNNVDQDKAREVHVRQADEATGDKPFDNMMKTIKKGTQKQATADRREQKAKNKERAAAAFGNMFGGGNPADKLKIKEQGVAEGGKETPQQQKVRAAISSGLAKSSQMGKAEYQSQPTKRTYFDNAGYASDKLTGIDSIDPDGTVVISIGDTGASDWVKKLAALGGMPGVKTREVQPKLVQGVAEGAGKQLSVQQLATISDAALDSAYGYGRSQPGNTFGWQANLASAAYAKRAIEKGVTDLMAISDAVHKGWWSVAQKFVDNPDQFSDTETLRAKGKFDKKMADRKAQMVPFNRLTKDQQDIDTVVARAMLQAITGGQQGVAEGNLNELFEPTLNYYKLSNGKTVQVSYRPNVNQSPVPFTDVSVSYVNPALKTQGPSFDSTGVAKLWTSAPDGVKQAIEKFVTQPQQGVSEGLKTKIEHLQRQLLEAKLAISLAKKTPL